MPVSHSHSPRDRSHLDDSNFQSKHVHISVTLLSERVEVGYELAEQNSLNTDETKLS